jgi:acylphosphatase
MTRRIVTVYGRVQGVFFRDTIVALAAGFAVSGSVRNLADPRALEVDVEGEPAEIDRFLHAALEDDPPERARIERVETREAPPLETRRGFRRV